MLLELSLNSERSRVGDPLFYRADGVTAIGRRNILSSDWRGDELSCAQKVLSIVGESEARLQPRFPRIGEAGKFGYYVNTIGLPKFPSTIQFLPAGIDNLPFGVYFMGNKIIISWDRSDHRGLP